LASSRANQVSMITTANRVSGRVFGHRKHSWLFFAGVYVEEGRAIRSGDQRGHRSDSRDRGKDLPEETNPGRRAINENAGKGLSRVKATGAGVERRPDFRTGKSAGRPVRRRGGGGATCVPVPRIPSRRPTVRVGPWPAAHRQQASPPRVSQGVRPLNNSYDSSAEPSKKYPTSRP
jgi:hypothetical protein